MKLWIDTNLPPGLVPWLVATFGVEAAHLHGAPLERAPDAEIFDSLRRPGQVIMSKDEDFVDLVTRLGPPPQVLWVRLGNATNRALRSSLSRSMPPALELLRSGEAIVEIMRAG